MQQTRCPPSWMSRVPVWAPALELNDSGWSPGDPNVPRDTSVSHTPLVPPPSRGRLWLCANTAQCRHLDPPRGCTEVSADNRGCGPDPRGTRHRPAAGQVPEAAVGCHRFSAPSRAPRWPMMSALRHFFSLSGARGRIWASTREGRLSAQTGLQPHCGYSRGTQGRDPRSQLLLAPAQKLPTPVL